nr:hypothetical protein [Tanacetum cinerariifolium]
MYQCIICRDDNKTRTRWTPDIRTRFDPEILELIGDGDGDGESPILKTGMAARMLDNYKRLDYTCEKISDFPMGIPVPDRDGDGIEIFIPVGNTRAPEIPTHVEEDSQSRLPMVLLVRFVHRLLLREKLEHWNQTARSNKLHTWDHLHQDFQQNEDSNFKKKLRNKKIGRTQRLMD